MKNLPYYRVSRAFYVTYHTVKGRAVYHLVICLSCGHWREIQNKTPSTNLIGRLFSCKQCGGIA